MSRIVCFSFLITILFSLSVFAQERSGRESHESLCKHARMIFLVEVVSTKDIRDRKAIGQPEEKIFPNASASVKWISDFRGKCPIQEFELVGGPYVGDSSEQNYLSFQKGERFYLLIDEPLTQNVKTVVITWQDRVCRLSEAQLKKITDNNRFFFEREIALHKKLAPKALERAEEILRDVQAGQTIPSAQLMKEDYPALACLELLLRNPDNPLEMKESARATSDDKSKEEDRYSTAGIYTRPQVLYEAMAIVVKKHNKEATEFIRRLQFDHMREDLCLSEENIKQYQADKSGESKLYKSVEMLKAMADDTPDALENKTVSGVEFKSLDPEIFIPFFMENPLEVADCSWSRLQVLLAMPHPLLKFYADQALELEKTTSRLGQYLRYYADLQEWKTCENIIDKYVTQAIDGAPWTTYNPEKLSTSLDEESRRLAEFREIISKASCSDAEVKKQLDEFETKIKDLRKKFASPK